MQLMLLVVSGEIVCGYEFYYLDFIFEIFVVMVCCKVCDGCVLQEWIGGWQIGNMFVIYLYVYFVQCLEMLQYWLVVVRCVL